MKDENEKPKDLLGRTREYALRIIRLYAHLPKTTEIQVIGRQFLRSGTSAGAHYAEAQRAKSNKDFVTKIEGALQELEETDYWLFLLAEVGINNREAIYGLKKETDELISILVTITKKVKSRG
jgi:four helix bundle protein